MSDSEDDSDAEEDSTQKKSKKSKTEEGPVDYTQYNDIQGEGGLIKTRSQRQQEMAKEKEFALADKQNNSTIDVDSVWESMKETSAATSARKSTDATVDTPKVSSTIVNSDSTSPSASVGSLKDEYITIKRVYNFAGKVTTEEKRVLESSAEGKAYIAQQQQNTDDQERKKRSLPPAKKRVGKRKKSTMMDELAKGKAQKLNTLEKSRLDWLGYVDKEGIKDDLSQHNKDGYLNKQDFLMRVEHRIDSDWKEGKKK